MIKRDPMFSTFRVGPAASGRELYDIDRVISELNHVSKNWEVIPSRKYTEYN